MARWLLPLLLLPSLAWADPPSARSELDTLARDPQGKPAAELIARARTAFTRADRLRAAGDAIRAKLAESTGEAWVHAARALVEVEQRRANTSTLESKAHDAEQRLSRARASLEASFAREQSLEADVARREADKSSKSAPAKPAPKSNGKKP